VTRARTAGLVGGAALLVLAFYVLVYPFHGYHVALGSDTPVYIWWTRYAGASGLGDFGTGPRSGLIAAFSTLSTVTGVPVADLAAVLGPVLAVALGLAAGALVSAAFGQAPGRTALTVMLTGTFLSLLVPGWFSTLGFGALFVAGCAVLAAGLDGPGWRPIAAAAVLFGMAGLFHSLFLVVAAVVLAGGLAALIPSSRRALAGGAGWWEVPGVRALAACGGGVAVAAIGLGAGGGLVGDLAGEDPGSVTARDTVLRRAGLTALLEDSYRRKLRHDFPWYRGVMVTALAFLPFGRPGPRGLVPGIHRRWAGLSPGPAFFWGVAGAWVGMTAAGIAGLMLGVGTPGQRLAAFCVALPMLGAVAVWALWSDPHRLVRAAAWVAVALFVVVAWMAWNGEPPLISRPAATQVRTAAAALARQPAETPMILVADDRSDLAGLFFVRNLNYLRAAVPGGRVPEVTAFVGTPQDLLAGRPGLTGDPEHDAMSRAFWDEVRPLLEQMPLAVSIRAFDRAGFAEASGLPGSMPLGPGVVALPGFSGHPCVGPCPGNEGSLSEPATLTFSPWLPVWAGPLVVVLLALLGTGWVRAAVPWADPGTSLALAPAFGLAGLALAGVIVDALGLRLGDVGGWVTATFVLVAGVAAALLSRRARSA
jgi:hypothetical protein